MVICHHCGTKSLSMSTVSYKSNLRGQYLNRKSYHHISLKFRKFLSLWVSVCLYFLQHYQWKKDVGSKTVIVPLFVHLIIALVTKLLWQGFHFFFSIWVFFHNHLRITGLQEKEEAISLTSYYHFHFHYCFTDT